MINRNKRPKNGRDFHKFPSAFFTGFLFFTGRIDGLYCFQFGKIFAGYFYLSCGNEFLLVPGSL